MTTITVDHVTKSFEPALGAAHPPVIVDNVSLKVASGSVLAILGPSGCGKSTLLRLIAGLIPPDSGRIWYDDTDLRSIPMQDRGIGMVFQDSALIPHWSAGKNIGFFLWLRKREQEVPERVARISQITGIGLEQLLDRRPGQLSGGERQRVGIARALARDPRVFLFDEPFSNIDAKLRGQARLELKRLLHEFPVTSFYVTHDQVEAIALAHRIAVMRAGKIEQVGSYDSLYRNPRNMFVATFIGTPTINRFRGHVIDHHWRGSVFKPIPIRTDLDEGSPVIMGARAEHIQMQSGGIHAVVETVTPHYAERTQWLEVVAGGERWTMQVSLDEGIEVGDTVSCALDEENVLFFDAETEQRIG